MDIQSWTATLELKTTQHDITAMREWLKEHVSPVPRRDADVIAKFLRNTMCSNAEWEGVQTGFGMERPKRIQNAPWQSGNQWEDWPDTPKPRSHLALAVDGCAALIVLAYVGSAAASAFTHSPHMPISWYDTGNAISSYAKSLVSSE